MGKHHLRVGTGKGKIKGIRRFAVVKSSTEGFLVVDCTGIGSPINGRPVGLSYPTAALALADLREVREQERDSRRGPIRSDPASQGTGGRVH